MLDFRVEPYIPSENDKYFTLKSLGSAEQTGEAPARVNLSAVEYYARLGMKPKSIQYRPHVNCTAMTIFNNNRIYEAYMRGKSEQEEWARGIQMEASKHKPEFAEAILSRNVGKAEEDAAAGQSMDGKQDAAPTWKIETPTFTSQKSMSDSERAEVEGIEEDD